MRRTFLTALLTLFCVITWVRADSLMGPPVAAGVYSYLDLTNTSTASFPNGLWRYDFAAGIGAQPLYYMPSANACNVSSFAGYIAGTTLTIPDSGTVNQNIRVGQTLQGGNVLSNTTIVSGAGTSWVVSKSQTIGSVGSPISFTTGDYAWQVVSKDGKCWNAVFPPYGMELSEWGAHANSYVDVALDMAIDFTCGTHAPMLVQLHPDPGQRYLMQAPHVIGNGAATTRSDCNAITFLVIQPVRETATTGSGSTVRLPFMWMNGTDPTIVPFTFQGPGTNFIIQNLGVECNSKCNTGIVIDNILVGTFDRMSVVGFTGYCMVFTTEQRLASGLGGFESTTFKQVDCTEPGAGGQGPVFGDMFCTAGNCTNSFIGNLILGSKIVYDNTDPNSCGFTFAFTNRTTFINLQAAKKYPTATGHSMCFVSPPGTTDFPNNLTIIHPVMDGDEIDPGLAWTGKRFGGIHIIDWSPVDNSTYPTYFPQSANLPFIWGNDTKNNIYPSGACTLVDASGGSVSFTSSNCQWSKANNRCIVDYTLVYGANADAAHSALIGGLPCTVSSPSSSVSSPIVSPYVALSMKATAGAKTVQPVTLAGASINNVTLSGVTISGTLNYTTSD